MRTLLIIEIALLVYFSRRFGIEAQLKGHSKARFIVITVICWIVLQALGLFVSISLFGDNFVVACIFQAVGIVFSLVICGLVVERLKIKGDNHTRKS